MKNYDNEALKLLESRLGYRFSDRALLVQSLTHRSAGLINNERLEFIGDAVVNLVVARAFFVAFPDKDEGVLTRLRASVVSGKSLAMIARDLSLSECLILGDNERKNGGAQRHSILADTLEALAGAVFLDSNPNMAILTVNAWLCEAIKKASPDMAIDAKTKLQEIIQARHEPLPIYELISVSGRGHEQVFKVSCFVNKLVFSEGIGSSRRRAEQHAANLLLDDFFSDE